MGQHMNSRQQGSVLGLKAYDLRLEQNNSVKTFLIQNTTCSWQVTHFSKNFFKMRPLDESRDQELCFPLQMNLLIRSATQNAFQKFNILDYWPMTLDDSNDWKLLSHDELRFHLNASHWLFTYQTENREILDKIFDQLRYQFCDIRI